MTSACPYADCRKAFTSDFNLQRHLKGSHLKERPFQCPDCFQTFGYRHVLMHHSEKKHPKVDCGPLPNKVERLTESISIPTLTSLTCKLADPHLGSFVHVNHIFMFPVAEEVFEVPPISADRQSSRPLPPLSDLHTRKKRRITPYIID